MDDNTVSGLIFVLMSLHVVEIALGNRCPVDWQLIEGVCFQYVEESVTWSEAAELCTHKYNSSLIVIDNQNVYDMIRQQVSISGTYYWIGANRHSFHKEYTWIDGTNLWANDAFWLPGEPSKSGEKCVLITTLNDTGAGFKDYYCYHNIGYICEHQDVSTCIQGWHKIGDTCLNFIHDDATSWFGAKAKCKSEFGSELAIIKMKNWSILSSFVKQLYGDDWSFWIGATFDEDGIFKWMDGSNIHASLWLPGEPNGFEHCVEFMIDSVPTGLNDEDCCQKRSFICGFKECRQIRNCKKQTCLDANEIVCSECEDNFQLTSDHLQCQLIHDCGSEQISYSESPLFISGWICAASLLIVLITTCVGFCIRERGSVKSNFEEENVRRSTQSSTTQLGNNTIEPQRTRDINHGTSDMTERVSQQYDDCYEMPNMYLELQNGTGEEHMYDLTQTHRNVRIM